MSRYITSGKYKGWPMSDIIKTNIGYMDYCMYERYKDEEITVSQEDEIIETDSEI